MKKLWIAAAAVALSGCAAKMEWTKPGAADADFRKDAYECERDARMVGPSGYISPINSPISGALERGSAAGSMQGFQNRCMQSRGYTLTRTTN